ncbi:MAG: 1-acyl-sn-glycerol-3-phosphate acyltransferase [Opitutales bacterium]|nr:1-acyl-sn-glycerol-3-phosphate acyltransferase [Opitutales bacterium]
MRPSLGARLPDVVCYFKASMHTGICGASGARLAGYLRNDSGIEGIRAAVAHLRAGGNVVLFPEGTRTPGAELGPLHPGFGLIAAQAACPVLCLRIETNSNLLGKAHTFWRAPTVPAHFRISELGTLRAEPGERPLAFAARVEACLKGGSVANTPFACIKNGHGC